MVEIFEIDLYDVSGICVGTDRRDIQSVDLVHVEPSEVRCGEILRHHCPVQIVRIEVYDVGGRTARVVVGDVGVVGDGVPTRYHRHAAANPAIDEYVHVDVREQFQLHVGHLQHGFPAQARRGVVVRWVETVIRHAGGAELLEDVGEQQDVGEQIEIVVVGER